MLPFWRRRGRVNYSNRKDLGIAKLIVKHLNNSLDRKDREILDAWISQDPGNKALFEKLTDPAYLKQKLALMDEIAKWETPVIGE